MIFRPELSYSGIIFYITVEVNKTQKNKSHMCSHSVNWNSCVIRYVSHENGIVAFICFPQDMLTSEDDTWNLSK
jgi:hypothetical protein